MKTISNWDDLREYGINVLTGEACTLGVRALCDVTEQGAAIMREFYGLPYDSQLNVNWNSGAVGSVFIPWSMFPDLAAFILIRVGNKTAMHVKGVGVVAQGATESDEEYGKAVAFYHGDIVRHYRPVSGQPSNGLSAVHAMSGRSQ